ncbi:MAG: pyridoxal phosphate-dependent aminotransferase [Candidatus Dojkabacteria bacterium]|jgi:aspartate/methionine/tyrosine aminotransferase|nr:pyridoxal phosphate-dependent aminotransferase [Candidatus Dojkabacteria bacterium]
MIVNIHNNGIIPPMKSFIDYYEFVSKNKKEIFDKLGYYYHFGKGDINRNVIKHDEYFFSPIIKSCLNNNVGYCDPAGRKSTRSIIALYESINRGIKYLSYKNISLSFGATNAIFGALRSLLSICGNKKNIIVLTPCYTYIEAIEDLGFKIKLISTNNKEESIKEIKKHIKKDCAAIFVSQPSFPEGKEIDKEIFNIIKTLSKENGVYIFIDEAYADVVINKRNNQEYYDENTVILRSLSKEWGVPGLRCGYVIGPEFMIDEIRRKNEYVFGCPIVLFEILVDLIMFVKICEIKEECSDVSDIYKLGIEFDQKQRRILDDIDINEFAKSCKDFKNRLSNVINEGLIISMECLESVDELSLIIPEYGFNAVVKNNTEYTYRDIFQNTGVVLTPGELFNIPGHFRFSFADSPENILEAWKRVINYVKT